MGGRLAGADFTANCPKGRGTDLRGGGRLEFSLTPA